MATPIEKALALIRWQPLQWQAIVRIGGALILIRTCPQRHPPSQGKCQSPVNLRPVRLFDVGNGISYRQ
jgi:hypothetical protein